MKRKFNVVEVCCANCAAKMEADIKKLDGVNDVKLNFQTNGTIGAILEKEGDERYYDLSSLHEFELSEGVIDKNKVSTYKLSNCYILDPNEYKDSEGRDMYDGYSLFSK